MRTLMPSVASAIVQNRVRLVQLIEMQMTSGTLYMNTSPWTIAWRGVDWLPIYGIGAIDTIDDQGAELEALNFTLSGVYIANIALVLTERTQGRPVLFYTAILDPARQVLDAMVEWAGTLDVPTINESGTDSTISISAEHFGIDLTRPSNALMSQQDQTRAYPGDNFYDKLIPTASQTIQWGVG